MKGDCEYSVVGDRVEKDRETGQGLAKSKLPMTEANFMKNSTFADIAKRQIYLQWTNLMVACNSSSNLKWQSLSHNQSLIDPRAFGLRNLFSWLS